MNAPEIHPATPLGLWRDMPEEWRPIQGYEGMYSVSSHGRVRSEQRFVVYRGSAMRSVQRRIVKPTTASGYLFVRLWRDGIEQKASVHRLVLLAFIGEPNDEQLVCAHNDGNPTNNAAWNLRWATPKENMADRVIHGTSNRGERHGMAKLTRDDVLRIRSDSRSNAAIADEFSIWPATVSRIKRRIDWGWL